MFCCFSYLEKSNFDLCQSAAEGDVKMLGWILSCRVSPNFHYGEYNITPLHYAARNNNAESSKLLLECGAEIEAKDIHDQTALYYAAHGSSTECVQILLKHGAEIEARNNYLQTPLHCAARFSIKEFVQILLKHGAEIEARDRNNHTPLHMAAEKIAQMLYIY